MAKKRKGIKFGLPDKLETFLIAMLFLMFFLFDVSQNKVLDHGLDYKVTFFTGIMVHALIMFYVGFLLYHVALFTLIGRSIWKKGTHHYYDWIVGIFAFIGMFLLIIGFVSDLFLGTHESVVWFFNLTPINIYHTGVGLQIFTVLYFIFTK